MLMRFVDLSYDENSQGCFYFHYVYLSVVKNSVLNITSLCAEVYFETTTKLKEICRG